MLCPGEKKKKKTKKKQKKKTRKARRASQCRNKKHQTLIALHAMLQLLQNFQAFLGNMACLFLSHIRKGIRPVLSFPVKGKYMYPTQSASDSERFLCSLAIKTGRWPTFLEVTQGSNSISRSNKLYSLHSASCLEILFNTCMD